MSSDRELFTALEGNSLIPSVKACSHYAAHETTMLRVVLKMSPVTVILVDYVELSRMHVALECVVSTGMS